MCASASWQLAGLSIDLLQLLTGASIFGTLPHVSLFGALGTRSLQGLTQWSCSAGVPNQPSC